MIEINSSEEKVLVSSEVEKHVKEIILHYRIESALLCSPSIGF